MDFLGRHMAFTYAFALVAVFQTACNKPNAPDCLQRAGEPAVETREFDQNIAIIEMHDVIDLVLHESDEQYIELRGPANLLSDIETTLDNGTLKITDENRCNFVRKLGVRYCIDFYGPFTQIDHQGAGNVTADGTLHMQEFHLENHGSSGTHSVDLDCDIVVYKTHTGTANAVLTGTCDEAFYFNAGLDKIDARNLMSTSVIVNSNSINSISVHALSYLSAQIQSDGDIMYWGQPSTIELQQEGDGQLLTGQ
ncbi:MAG: hypothetical protein ACI9HG_001220 [Flavobacteriales bacterium]|jgi:hypothetical protein